MSYRRAPLAVPVVLPVITTITIAGRRARDRLGRGESPAEGLRRGPAAHAVRARQGRAADPDLRLRGVPGADPGLAEVEVAGGELPEVRQRELRHRQDLRLHRRYRDQHQDRGQPGPQEGERRRPRGREGPGSRRTRPGRHARRPGHHPGRQEHQADPRRAEQDHRRATRNWPPPPRPATRSPRNCPPTTSTPKPGSRCCAPAAAACRWCCGYSRTTPSTGYRATSTPTCKTTTNTALSPARPSSAAWPGPSPTPRRPSPSRLQRPGAPRVARALALLIDEINAHPARHARRHQAHHLPAHRAPARIKQITQNDYRRSGTPLVNAHFGIFVICHAARPRRAR